MSQNTSSAVMQQRREPHDSLDDFPTPPWATRALLEELFHHLSHPVYGERSVREPSANRGNMVRPLDEHFGSVEASDIFDYGAGFPVQDYLFGPPPPMVDWTITNPPFRLAQQFLERAIDTSREGVALLVRTAFVEGQDRYQSLFKPFRPRLILQFTERVVMQKGKLLNPNVAVLDETTGKRRKPTTATAYCWVVWTKPWTSAGTGFDWIAPCRRRLERPGDYEERA